MSEPLRVLFVKERMAWPRSSGHDVHTFFTMQAMAEQGHAVALASMDRIPPESIAEGRLEADYCFADASPAVPTEAEYPLRLSKLQAKFISFWGVNPAKIRWVAAAAQEFRADAVVVSGLNVLPYLGALPPETVKAWYAADEWVWHHYSQVSLLKPRTWGEVKIGTIKGVYEWAYRKLLDRVWVVSPADATAFRWFAGIRQTDLLPNGVDATHYAPADCDQHPNSCVFWGRLDFGPNIQAVEWFCRNVWPKVRAAVPNAKFQLYGFQPGPEVTRFVGQNGVYLTADLPDIRDAVRSQQVVVLPFVSGGGIKNKLLEAAAMGMPILGAPRAFTGLLGEPPMPKLHSPREWITHLTALWQSAEERRKQGAAARAWVTQHHTWAAAARTAAAGLIAACDGRRKTEQVGV